MIHQSGGCCDGSSPICIPAAELPPGPGDVLLGRLGATPVYVDGEQDTRFGEPDLLIDVAPGPAMGFSLEGALGVHFLSCAPAPQRCGKTPTGSAVACGGPVPRGPVDLPVTVQTSQRPSKGG